MEKITQGVEFFQEHVFPAERELYEKLATGQTPRALFVSCADSRVDPNRFTNSPPGELFHLRNAGNIVPPYGSPGSAEAATIEYAVSALGIRDIIVCGHSDCGAMRAAFDPAKMAHLPAVSRWLRHAERARCVVAESNGHFSGERCIRAMIDENVLAQLLHLQTHPAVAARLSTGDIRLYGWVYEIGTGSVFAYHPEAHRFEPMRKVMVPLPALMACNQAAVHAGD